MQLKTFVLPIKNLSAAESAMNAFLRSHRMLTVKKEFVSDGENSFWTFCVEYLESSPADRNVDCPFHSVRNLVLNGARTFLSAGGT